MSGILEWDYGDQEDGTHKIAGEVQLRTYRKFLDDYSSQLRGIEEALDESISDTWDATRDPIALKFLPHEQTTLLKLIDTDNKILNKVLTVLAALCIDVKKLQDEARSKYFGALLFYGEGGTFGNNGLDAQMSISHFIPFLQELFCFVTRCEQVMCQIVKQLSAVHDSSKSAPGFISASDVHFQIVFEHLGDLLVVLITLDEIISSHHTLIEHWLLYKRTVKSVQHDPSKFGIDGSKLKLFERIIHELEEKLMKGTIFQRCVEQSFEDTKSTISKNAQLSEEFLIYLRSSLSDLEMKVQDQLHYDNLHLWIKGCALCALNFNLFGSLDKKIFKQIWDLSKKIPAVNLVGNVLWFPETFLLARLPQLCKMIDRKTQQAVQSNRQTYLQTKTTNLPRELQLYYFQTCSWMIHMETNIQQYSDQWKFEDLYNRCSLFLQGLQYACGISRLLKTVTNLHVYTAKPMTKTAVLAVCRLIELLKGIQHMYHRHCMSVAESVNHIVQHLSYQALKIISAAKKNIIQDKRYSEKRLDILSSLLLAESALNGPGTKERRLVMHLALSTANQMKTFKEEDINMLNSTLYRLDSICDLQDKLTAACDCSFLYWHRVILPIYFSNIYETRADFHRVSYVCCALQDCVHAMKSVRHVSNPDELKVNLENDVYKLLETKILIPFCNDIETDLRLHVHSHLQLDDRNPFRVGIQNFVPMLRLRPLRFFDRYISIQSYVEHYLNQMFYNLTTVALHDWKTYGKMRSLAKHKFDLHTVDDYLPSQTLDQGLDVLEIMRNIHIFVSKYLYNLNNQFFIEKSSNNKHLNTINIRHIANSIRTHGTGIMNTTVNFTYQFLRKKFFIFSQFMYDEHIKSRLIKDLRYFRENRTQLDQKYSYERAEKFNRGIRKLGITEDGLSYLDQFRNLISHIGNAMGYIRMIRSGGLHCCSNAICFIPDLDDIVNFEELCVEEGLSRSCINSASCLDQTISNWTRNFAEGTEYFKLLVKVFTPVIRDPKNIHLRNFHVIVPALTINFVEHSITCKEKMSKKNKVGASFTDDGFAMGVAYILKLIDLNSEFDSLHWFQSVREKYAKDKASLSKQKDSSSKDDEKLQQTMTLTAKRLDLYQQEFDLLYYSLSSARIFFQRDKSGDVVDEKKNDSKSNSELSNSNVPK
ncbi:WASH complex subunit 4 [Ischnura elegans]|uniref:WASH complex subunit 4 n=1 Tax=Ischnura elegans TaxID=197161 RepID=UPI001ED8745D|nr:WASH complex subunit 4 [Ischnura elegans]